MRVHSWPVPMSRWTGFDVPVKVTTSVPDTWATRRPAGTATARVEPSAYEVQL
ncbi:hypothetical protein EES39_12585 [Streptomyces sp. ADI92-24]|nr:hypothetical protein EES39_12585 [Streptomyces sp. ADI92-24]